MTPRRESVLLPDRDSGSQGRKTKRVAVRVGLFRTHRSSSRASLLLQAVKQSGRTWRISILGTVFHRVRAGDAVTRPAASALEGAGDLLQLKDSKHPPEPDVLTGHHQELEQLGVVEVLLRLSDELVVDGEVVDG